MGFTEGYITESKENLFWIRFKRFRRRFTQVKKGRRTMCCWESLIPYRLYEGKIRRYEK